MRTVHRSVLVEILKGYKMWVCVILLASPELLLREISFTRLLLMRGG